MSVKIFEKELNKRISEHMLANNFRKKKYGFYKELDDNNYGIVEFSKIKYKAPGCIFIVPHIGLLNIEVERIFLKLTGFDKLKVIAPTIHLPIGYIMAENKYKEWEFVQGVDNDAVFMDMFKTIDQHTPLFWNKFKTRDTLFEAYRNAKGILSVAGLEYLPILYFLKGEKEKGLACIQENIKRMSTPIPAKGDWNAIFNENQKGRFTSGHNGQVDPAYTAFAYEYEQLITNDL